MNKHMVRLWIGMLVVSCFVSCVQEQEKEFTFQRTSPEKQGMRTVGILRFLEETQARGIDMHSLMILRHGKVITEGWWYPYKPQHRHIMHSVSKTFTSTAIGFAVEEKLLTVNDKVISFFPDDLPPEVSPYLEELSVKHLLTMSVGQDPAPVFTHADGDWVKLFLATPIVNRPGEVFLYSSYASHMLAAIVRKVSGQTVFEYLQPRLFEPLGISDIQWEIDASGNQTGGWGMRIRTEDMARLGQFYLQQGRWQEKQLLSKDWIKEATSVQIYQRDELTLDEQLHDNWAQGYGYQIWRCTDNAYRADGADGQFIVVMPEQDAVVVITENTRDTQQTLHLVFEYLLPVMMDGEYAVEEEDQEELVSLLSALSIPDPFRTGEEIEPLKNTTRTYAPEANEMQLQNISFAFDEGGDCRLTFTQGGESCTFLFGIDAWRYGETAKKSPYFLNPRRNPEGLGPFAVAGYGSWISGDELQLRLLYLEDYQQETCICRFDGEGVEITLGNKVVRAKITH
ncbi:MAG: beta-lactamase family protein [Tannerellaceae bacterium]|jgi:CubicO group peptidase (beta-lactamase class C family)|nr:beta-lactamase family protein [Tannerellaceae bacterium]